MNKAHPLLLIFALICGSSLLGMEQGEASAETLHQNANALHLQSKFFKALEQNIAVNRLSFDLSEENEKCVKSIPGTDMREGLVEHRNRGGLVDSFHHLNSTFFRTTEEHGALVSAALSKYATPNTSTNKFHNFYTATINIQSTTALIFSLRNVRLLNKPTLTNQDLQTIYPGLDSPDFQTKKLCKVLYFKYLESLTQRLHEKTTKKVIQPAKQLQGRIDQHHINPSDIGLSNMLAPFKLAYKAYLAYGTKLLKDKTQGSFTSDNTPEDIEFWKKLETLVGYHKNQKSSLDKVYSSYVSAINEMCTKNRSLIRKGVKKRLDKTEKMLPDSLAKYHQEQELITFAKLYNDSLTQETETPTPIELPYLPQKKNPPTKKKNRSKKSSNSIISEKPKKTEEDVEQEPLADEAAALTLDDPRDEEALFQMNDSFIEIPDAENDVTILLYKVATHDHVIPNLKYHERINAWFDNPEEALLSQGYCTPGQTNYTPEEWRKNAVLRHSFPKIVDQFLPQLGIKTDNKSKSNRHSEISISIPGEIREPNGNRHIVLFTYGIDSATGCCYHRCATTKASDAFLAEYMEKGKWEVDFPPLQGSN